MNLSPRRPTRSGVDPDSCRSVRGSRGLEPYVPTGGNSPITGIHFRWTTSETRGFIDSKLRDLGVEQRRLQRRLEELEGVPYTPMDADAVLKQGLWRPWTTCRA